MDLRINRKRIWHVIHVLSLIILYFALSKPGNENELYTVLQVYSFAGIATLFFSRRFSLMSPYTFILLFSYMFNCGEVWLRALGIEMPLSGFSLRYFSQSSINQGLFFVLLFLALIQLFAEFFRSRRRVTVMRRMRTEEEKKRLRTIAVLLFIPVFPLTLVYDYMQFSTALRLGYRAALGVRSASSILSFANCAMPLIMFIYIDMTNDKVKKAIASLYCLIRYTLYLFIVGTRMLPLAVFFCLLAIWFRNRKLVLKWKVFLGVLMLVILFAAAYVAKVRDEGTRSMSVGSFLIRYNPLVLVVQEIGGTFIDMPLVIDNIGSIGYAYGRTYLYMGLGMIPKISVFVPDILKYASISSILNGYFYKGRGLGGSVFAELYYNFGPWSLLLSPLLAWLYVNVTKDFYAPDQARRCRASYLFLIFAQYVRGTAVDVTDFFRVLLYFFVVYDLLVLPRLSKGGRRRRRLSAAE